MADEYPTKQQQKDKIRERYKGLRPKNVEVFPAKKKPGFYDDEPRRVAVYVRVSTDEVSQTSSYELQKNYYEDMVRKHESWTLAKIYADEGISGTSLKKRDAFNQMIQDCRDGKIDMILTKSVSRFARNIVDCISIVRELADLKPPVGVFFETEHIFTLMENSEMGLSFLATMAQEESHIKSNLINASLEMRFSHGILITPPLIGYDQDENGNLVINEEEAKIVRLIFFLYLYGYSTSEIANKLNELDVRTKKGRQWTQATIAKQLRNERHCGDVLTWKTVKPSYLHTSRGIQNTGQRTQYLWKEHHEAIISREDYIAVQHIMDNAKYGKRNILPVLSVIQEGALKGFVRVHPRWGGFSPEDYIDACRSVYGKDGFHPPEMKEVHVQPGDFDLRGYEVVRSLFLCILVRPNVTFTSTEIDCSTPLIHKLDDVAYVEFLVHPLLHLLAIRKSTRDNRYAVRWSRDDQLVGATRTIRNNAFLETFYALFGWNLDYQYRVFGTRRKMGAESVVLFNMDEYELVVRKDKLPEGSAFAEELKPLILLKHREFLSAFPKRLAGRFGDNYYVHQQAKELFSIDNEGLWDVLREAEEYLPTADSATPLGRLHTEIQKLLDEKTQEKKTDES